LPFIKAKVTATSTPSHLSAARLRQETLKMFYATSKFIFIMSRRDNGIEVWDKNVPNDMHRALARTQAVVGKYREINGEMRVRGFSDGVNVWQLMGRQLLGSQWDEE